MPAQCRHQLLLLPLLLLLLRSSTFTDALARPATSSRHFADDVSPAVAVDATVGGGGGGDAAPASTGHRRPIVNAGAGRDDDAAAPAAVEEVASDTSAHHLVAPDDRRAAATGRLSAMPNNSASASQRLATDATAADVFAGGHGGGGGADVGGGSGTGDAGTAPGKDGREAVPRPAGLWRPTVAQSRTARSADWRLPGMDYHSSWLPQSPTTTTTTTTTASTTTTTAAAKTATLKYWGSTQPPRRWADGSKVDGVAAGSPPSEQRSTGALGPDAGNVTAAVAEGSAAPGRGRAAGTGRPSTEPHLHHEESPSTALGRRGPLIPDERPSDDADDDAVAQPPAGADPGSRRRAHRRHGLLGAAWAVHVYGCGALFLLLALASAAVAVVAGIGRTAETAASAVAATGGREEPPPPDRASPLFASKSAAPTSALAGGWLLCAAGTARALLLLLAGAYNADGGLGAGAARLLYDVPFPCLTAAHAAALASLAKAAEPRLPAARERRLLAALAAAVALHFLLALGGSLAAGLAGPGSPASLAAPSVALVYFCAFGAALLALAVVGTCGGTDPVVLAEKGHLVFSPASAPAATPSPSSSSARSRAAVAAGALVAACGVAQASGVALGFVGDFEVESPAGRAPAWWSFHFCARVLELAACLALCLTAAAAVPFRRRKPHAGADDVEELRRRQPVAAGLAVPLARCDEALEPGKGDGGCWGKLSRLLCGLGAGDSIDAAAVTAGASGGIGDGRREPQTGTGAGRTDVGRPRGTPDGLESGVTAPFASSCTATDAGDDDNDADGGKRSKRKGDSDPGVDDSDDSSYDEDDDEVCDGSRRGKAAGGRRRRNRKHSGSGHSLGSSLLLLHPFTMSDLDLRPPSPIELWRSIDDALLERAVITESLFRRSHSAGNLSTMGDAEGTAAGASVGGPERPGRLQRLFRGSALSLRKSSSRLAMASSSFGSSVSRAPSLVMQSPLGSTGVGGWSRRDASFASLMSLGLGWSKCRPRDLAPVPVVGERALDLGSKHAVHDGDADDAASVGRRAPSVNINQEFNHICKQINHLSMSSDTIDV
ncbi:proline-rich transmembrane protein 4 [Lethenteron reissneri]|uniref:proline-rich transmembrane protein 4 n=1 Tax=Lethenteron reissneri TaxID=7753 RepID=UPI002AB750E3|nr:proline-rich transmembrane protein 4 [Lethenteron reissneri]XP_061428688.1 proline-rich transmembrane protein 4 [Lethenteron reissneri]XP_061428689.1 proline-rich transmembrane protein 4 [Lethenteron reissneri]